METQLVFHEVEDVDHWLASPKREDRSMRVCEQLQTGMVGLNQGLLSNAAAPFGGSSTPASGARAAWRASRSTSTSSYVAMKRV